MLILPLVIQQEEFAHKMKTLNKNFNLGYLFLITMSFLLLINFVGALAISQEYHSENPAKVGPGETKEISFALLLASQADGDRNVELNLTEGGEIATIIGEKSFIVKAGSMDKEIKLRVSVPQGAAEGTKYTVTIRVFDKTSPPEGMVGFTTSTTSSIPVLVEKTPEPSTAAPEKPAADYSWYIIVLVIIIIIVIVAYFLLRNKDTAKNKSK